MLNVKQKRRKQLKVFINKKNEILWYYMCSKNLIEPLKQNERKTK